MNIKIVQLTLKEKLEWYSTKYLMNDLKSWEKDEFFELLLRFYNEYLYQRGIYKQKIKREVKVEREWDY